MASRVMGCLSYLAGPGRSDKRWLDRAADPMPPWARVDAGQAANDLRVLAGGRHGGAFELLFARHGLDMAA